MNDQLLWYTTRASGTISLIFLTAVVVVGLLARLRFETAGWPRFLSAALHGNLALMTLVFLAVHIVTAVVDPFTSLGITPVLIPFGSSYRTFWLGLGTVSLELILAIIATSLLRNRIGAQAWRLVHWLAYVSWPIAVLHGLGTGTDPRSVWLMGITILCCLSVASVLVWRLVAAPVDPLAEARQRAAGASRVAGP